MNQRLAKQIDRFLAEKRKSVRGGWAEITDKDVNDFYEIIYALLSAKCEPDADGDYPVQVKLINRRVFHKMHYSPVHYGSLETDNPENDALCRDDLLYNLNTAVTAMRDELRLAAHRQRDAEAAAVRQVLKDGKHDA